MCQTNAECGWCAAGLRITGDGSHPTARVLGQSTKLVFCNSTCYEAWQHDHCGYCGATPQNAMLRIENNYGKFCSTEHAAALEPKSHLHTRLRTVGL